MIHPHYADETSQPKRPMRLFLSLVPPAGACAEVGAALATVPAPVREAPGVRWLDPRRWHITLVFLGDVDPSAVPRLVDALGEAAAGAPPPGPVSLRGAGSFGASALWLGVTDTTGGEPTALVDTVHQLRLACGRVHVPYDRKPWRPHLSVARARRGGDVRGARAALDKFRGSPWDVTGFALVHSVTGPAPTHTDLATFAFGGGRGGGSSAGADTYPGQAGG